MMIGLRLFISSAVFAIVIAIAYWFVAHEIVGTFLLAFMAFALSFLAGYMIVAEREADLYGDRNDAKVSDGAGELVGTYSTRSPLPIWTAIAVTCICLGLVISPTLAGLGVLAALVLGAFFIMQSR
ncbi:MAG TPA: cytochrome c oxidase subunit 4 [Candidatus Elarobacter sp.]